MPAWGVIVGISFVVAAVFGIAEYIGLQREKETDEPRRTEKKSTTGLSQADLFPAPMEQYQRPSEPVAGCRCWTGDGQSVPRSTLTLLVPVTANPPKPIELGVERGGKDSFSGAKELALAGSALASWLDGSGLPRRMGLACDVGTFALVVGATATGWSSEDGTLVWNTTLPAMLDGVDAGPPTGHTYDSACEELKVEKGSATLELVNGKTATLSLADGRVH